MLSTSDTGGGAAIAAARLVAALRNRPGIDVAFVVGQKRGGDTEVHTAPPETPEAARDEQAIARHYIAPNRTERSGTLFSFSCAPARLERPESYDLFHLHWVEHFLAPQNLDTLVRLNRPIVWTLHDMKPFTGGCHYSAGCEGFTEGCFPCPQLYSDPERLPREVLRAKTSLFENAPLTVVAPSVWLAEEARRSTLFRDKRIEVIPNGIDTEAFRPVSGAKARLGLDETCTVVMFASADHRERRKGFKELIQALGLIEPRLKDHSVIALLVGGGTPSDALPLPTLHLGRVTDEAQLRLAYSAADLFVLPSLEDNLPNTLLESLACETPVVAFDAGGVSDVVGKTNGILVPCGDVEALSDAIETLIAEPELRRAKGRAGRRTVEERFSLSQCAAAYADLYRSLLEAPPAPEAPGADLRPFERLVDTLLKESGGEARRALEFSAAFNRLFSEVQTLRERGDAYVLYGAGSVGRTLTSILGSCVVASVDREAAAMGRPDVLPPEALKKLEYDAVIITVLGREREISRYLQETFHIPEIRIITLTL